MNMPSPALLDRFIAITGRQNVLTENDDLTHYTHENRDIIIGKTPLVLKPANVHEISSILKLAHETQTAIVPQGGHTGHAGGGVPDASGTQIVLSMERLNKICDVDAVGNTMTVEAGVILQNIQQAAQKHDRFFPLALASQGSCQIGGNIATNAGGVGVLAYGNTRDLVLGLEAVTAQGKIIHGMGKLKKDNTGYDLKNLLIGSEGTLAVISAATLKLFPNPKGRAACFVGLNSAQSCLDLLNLALDSAGSTLTGFEFMPLIGVDAVFDHHHQICNPLTKRHNMQVLAEITSTISQADADERLLNILKKALDSGIIEDAAISQSENQRLNFWAIRETMPASQKKLGWSIKHDISVAVHHIPKFLERARLVVEEACPGARPFAFGHMGDGNIHYNVSQPVNMDLQSFLDHSSKIQHAVFELVVEFEGSVSAEHGIGALKRELLHRTKDPVSLSWMKAIKQALDPKGILNPGKVI